MVHPHVTFNIFGATIFWRHFSYFGAKLGLAVTGSSAESVSLSWQLPTYTGAPPSPIAGFRIAATALAAPPPSPAAPSPVSVLLASPSLTSHTVTGLQPGWNYDLTVVTMTEAGKSSPPSPSVSAATSPSSPDPPTDLAIASPPAPRAISLQWNAPVETGFGGGEQLAVAGYHIAYVATEGPAAGADVVAVTPDDATSATLFLSVLPGTTFSIRLSTLNSAGLLSPFSTPPLVVVTPVGPPDPPGLLELVSSLLIAPALATDPHTVSSDLDFVPPLAVGAASAHVAAYNASLTRFDGPDAPYTPVAFVLPAAKPWRLHALVPGTRYELTLATHNSLGVTSHASAPLAFTTPVAPPSAIPLLSLSPSSAPAPVGTPATLAATWSLPAFSGGAAVALDNVTLVLVDASGVVTSQTLPASAPFSTTFTGLAQGTGYTVTATATSDAGLTSAAVTADGATAPGIPAAPTSVAVAGVGETYVELSFTINSPDALGGTLASLANVTISVDGIGSRTLTVSQLTVISSGWPSQYVASSGGDPFFRLLGSTSYTARLAVTSSAGLASAASTPVSFTTLAWGSDPRLDFAPPLPLVVRETDAGTAFSLLLTLPTPPAPGTTISVPLAIDSPHIELRTTSVAFAPGEWNIPQTISVVALGSPVAHRAADGSPQLPAGLSLGPLVVAGPDAASSASLFYSGFASTVADAVIFVDTDVIAINATAVLTPPPPGAQTGMLAVLSIAISLASTPVGPVTLDMTASPLLAAAGATSLSLPGTATVELSADALVALAAEPTVPLGTVAAPSDPGYAALAPSVYVADADAYLPAASAHAAAPPTTWSKYVAVWVILIVLAVLCIGAVAVVAVASYVRGQGMGSKRPTAVQPSPPATPRHDALAAVAAGGSAGRGVRLAELDSSEAPLPMTDAAPRRSPFSTGAKAPRPLRSSGSSGRVARAALAPSPVHLAETPAGAAARGRIGIDASVATPLGRAETPLGSSTAAGARPSRPTTTYAGPGLVRGDRSLEASTMEDSALASEASMLHSSLSPTRILGLHPTPSSARRRPLALPPVHKASPVPFMPLPRTPSQSHPAGPDPVTPIPYLHRTPTGPSPESH
ncbi:uncharacterized protein AMSG_06617 [Thecamonas trahens ATCC 50062]|uniref:Fibronectin type-III domain-containing protein n=1 Tax=Thecamonas trahens ATCC 50062 TaxID=461836 RepID=A0A0L0DEH1_THETB|nr:hypothetical protein AMSG_06617 [Thecamonas trahens ATCC 50062]KNC50727.1 hypothetical protein AMSG_06617 [Thecamonas trahens ATCC 50062]|eukprot:XP_013756695.1 hypothetical protein AMSG_06617 [Thecamonas trahens ATCC 50062]